MLSKNNGPRLCVVMTPPCSTNAVKDKVHRWGLSLHSRRPTFYASRVGQREETILAWSLQTSKLREDGFPSLPPTLKEAHMAGWSKKILTPTQVGVPSAGHNNNVISCQQKGFPFFSLHTHSHSTHRHIAEHTHPHSRKSTWLAGSKI